MNVGSTCQNWVRYPGTVQSYTAIIQRLWQWQAKRFCLRPVWKSWVRFGCLAFLFWCCAFDHCWPSPDHESAVVMIMKHEASFHLLFHKRCDLSVITNLSGFALSRLRPCLTFFLTKVHFLSLSWLPGMSPGTSKQGFSLLMAEAKDCLWLWLQKITSVFTFFHPTYCRRRLGIEGKVLACHTATSTELPFSSKETSR